jgi:hypothetical protein
MTRASQAAFLMALLCLPVHLCRSDFPAAHCTTRTGSLTACATGAASAQLNTLSQSAARHPRSCALAALRSARVRRVLQGKLKSCLRCCMRYACWPVCAVLVPLVMTSLGLATRTAIVSEWCTMQACITANNHHGAQGCMPDKPERTYRVAAPTLAPPSAAAVCCRWAVALWPTIDCLWSLCSDQDCGIEPSLAKGACRISGQLIKSPAQATSNA